MPPKERYRVTTHRRINNALNFRAILTCSLITIASRKNLYSRRISSQLEQEFQTELDLPRVKSGGKAQRIGRCDIASARHAVTRKRRVADHVVNAGEINAIEEVEGLEDSLQPVRRVRPQQELLSNTEIHRHQIGP